MLLNIYIVLVKQYRYFQHCWPYGHNRLCSPAATASNSNNNNNAVSSNASIRPFAHHPVRDVTEVAAGNDTAKERLLEQDRRISTRCRLCVSGLTQTHFTHTHVISHCSVKEMDDEGENDFLMQDFCEAIMNQQQQQEHQQNSGFQTATQTV